MDLSTNKKGLLELRESLDIKNCKSKTKAQIIELIKSRQQSRRIKYRSWTSKRN